MHIIINRGFENQLTRTIVFKNKEIATSLSFKNDHYHLCANEGDQFSIKLKVLGLHEISIADFSYKPGMNICYITESWAYKVWEMANYKILPYLCLVLLGFSAIAKSEQYEWICACAIALTALSLMAFQLCLLCPASRKGFFSLQTFSA